MADGFDERIVAAVRDGNAELVSWSNSLKRKSIEDIGAEAAAFFPALLEADLHPAKLLDIMEAVRTGLYNFAIGREDLSEDARAECTRQLLSHELDIHERLIHLSHDKDLDILAVSLHRSLSALIERQWLHYQHYLPIPAKEWIRIHRMFYLATQKKISSFSIADKVFYPGKSLTIINLYCLSLLMGCGRLNHLTAREMQRVSKSIPDWSTLVTISRTPASNSDNQLVFDISAGEAPHFQKLFTPSKNAISCYLQVDRLVEKLDSLFAEASKREADPTYRPPVSAFGIDTQPLRAEIISHLKSAWSEYIYREERIKTDENVRVCLGLDNIFFHLAGNQTLKDFVGIKMSLSIVYDAAEDATSIQQKRSGDIWSSFLSVPEGSSLVAGEIPAEYNFQHFFPARSADEAHPDQPVLTARMTDKNTRGCCLQWHAHADQAPEIGELVALCREDSQGHWHIGEVAWKFQSDTGDTSTGIRLLSTKAIPVAIDVPLRLGLPYNHASGILVPPEEQLNTHGVTLVMPPLKLNIEEYISITQKGIEEKVRLNRLAKMHAGYESYNVAFVVLPKAPVVDRKP